METVVSKIRYGSLDGLRAIAAFCIVMMHVRANYFLSGIIVCMDCQVCFV